MRHWRLNVLLVWSFLLAALVVSRLFYIQVVNHKLYQAQVLGQQASFREVSGNRGEIFFQESREHRGRDSQGKALEAAINHVRYTIVASPRAIEDKERFVQLISEKIKQPPEVVFEKINNDSLYVVLKKNVSIKEMEEIQDIRLRGLVIEKELSRLYPQKNMASHVVGFVGGSGQGQYGLEGRYENILKGEKGFMEGKWGLGALNTQDSIMSLSGSDLFLTIDHNIQFQAESLLSGAREEIGIDSGQIIVLKPDSGKVLAMANFPFFDSNNYAQERNLEIFQNSAVQKIFEPGSVFKPFTMAMAFQEGKVSPEDIFKDTGSVTVGPDTIYNFNRRVYGEQSMSEIMEKSINTGAVFLYQSVGRQTFLRYLEKFGFHEKTGIDLQGEVYSRNENLRRGSEFGFVTASFGQGIEMTPIQLVKAFSAFANKGRIVTPYVVEKISHGGNQLVTKPQISEQVISEKTAFEVTKTLINVVEQGFGSQAKIPGYYLAGKTGTAQVPRETIGGYHTDRTIQSFIGFGPALQPEFLILVKLDNPKVSQSSLSAAPIFKNLAQYIINYWRIPPDYDI